MTAYAAPSTTLLRVTELTTQLHTHEGIVRAVDGVSFDLEAGQTLGLVGESGCGKTMTALSLVKLLPDVGRIVSGQVFFNGIDLVRASQAQMRALRGKSIGFIFQDPMTSLNPTHTVGRQIAESARTHLGLTPRAALDHAAVLLERVGIPNPRRRLGDYPHQFSGGMRQRVMIAVAIACNPQLLIADEPTTALDVTIQAQILELIRSLAEELMTAVILITHDLGIAAGMCDRINVMYAGRVVESGPVDAIFSSPEMPYTRGLLDSLPGTNHEPGSRLRTIEGYPPNLIDLDTGCRFMPRCGYAREVCGEEPSLRPRDEATHVARCWGTEPLGWIE